jgi:hypothetical protein
MLPMHLETVKQVIINNDFVSDALIGENNDARYTPSVLTVYRFLKQMRHGYLLHRRPTSYNTVLELPNLCCNMAQNPSS